MEGHSQNRWLAICKTFIQSSARHTGTQQGQQQTSALMDEYLDCVKYRSPSVLKQILRRLLFRLQQNDTSVFGGTRE
jgi:hypothetical protein